jgi:hypothetical protein
MLTLAAAASAAAQALAADGAPPTADVAAPSSSSSWLDAVRPMAATAGSDSQPMPPLGEGCTQFDWESTQRVQAELRAHQYVADCASPDTKFLVLRTWKTGALASVAQEVSTALHIAYVTGRVLLFQGDGSPRTGWNLAGPECGGRTWDCYFEPLSNCRLEDAFPGAPAAVAAATTVVLSPDNFFTEEAKNNRVVFVERPRLNAWNREVAPKYVSSRARIRRANSN